MRYRMVEGGERAFNALLYRPPEQHVLDHINQGMQHVGSILGDGANKIMETAKSIYDKFNSSAVINAAKMFAYGYSGGHTSSDQIVPLTYDSIHTANYIMQQYIMCNPEVNKLHQDNMCYGFQDTYYDPEQGVYGKERADYRNVMSGVVEFDETGSYYTTYSGEGEKELSCYDRYAILDTWDEIAKMLAKGIDPTSPDGDEL